jgi:2-keto-4-pentenoate hydratase/2-oxohepta-3-ene-1,7-dioic acid hydratase in catechol pathway
MKIICIGKNYAEHAHEMQSAVPTEPVFFLKPDTALLPKGNDFYYPSFTQNLHHEVEIVLKIAKNGKNIAPKFAHQYVSEIGIGIDFTARDLQDKAKQKGLPWEIAKSFDNAAVVSPNFIRASEINNINNINFSLLINGKTVQQGNTSQMVFPYEQLLSYVSGFITLKTGDLFFTGTPAGVGPVRIGDKLQAFIENRLMLDFEVK